MDIRNFFFKYRSFTPVPIALLIIYFAHTPNPLIIYGIVILALGEGIRLWAVAFAGGKTRTREVGAPSLCTSGPYAQIRNPLYTGNMLMYAGIVLIAGAPNIWWMLAVTMIFFLIQYSLIISLEEETLKNLFGQEYETYQENVPSILPRLRPWKNKDQREPMSLLKTLKTEKRTLQNVVFVLLLISIRIQYFS
ncbi:MAG: methyltransferase family protein [Fidelibacterota bacterium]